MPYKYVDSFLPPADDDQPSAWEREQARLMVLPAAAPAERSWFVQRLIELFQQMARGTSVRSW